MLTEAKAVALRCNRTLTAVIVQALRQFLAQQLKVGEREPVRLKTVGGRGLQPGVNLDNSAALLDLMDGSS